MGNSPVSTPLTAPFTRRVEVSPSCRIEADFSPPADLTSQHRTVESKLPETRTDDSAEKEREVMAELCPVIFLMGREEPRSHSHIEESRPYMISEC